MHIGKKHNKDICSTCSVDAWKDEVFENNLGEKYLKDTYEGRKVMKDVKEKKYLGDIISNDGKNQKNITDRTNKAIGNINRIESTLRERHYGRHYFKAFRLMREGLLLGGLLNNVESWINVSKNDLEALEKPDVILMRKVLSSSGNTCKTCTMLELGILPVKFVIMKKRLQLLHYIINKNTTSMIRQVYGVLEKDLRK